MLPGHPLIKLYPFFVQNSTGTTHDSSFNMKSLILLCCFFTVVIAEKQLKLEDIERDNLASERENKEQKSTLKFSPKYSQPYNPPSFRSSQPNNFGFTPINDKPKLQFQSTKIQQEIHQENQQENQQEQIQYSPPQYYYQQQPQIQPQPQPQPQIINQYPYEQTPYIIDNQINTPQYVYLQPSSSNNIQMVVDSKGQVKYFMYVPVPYVKQDSQYNNVGPQIFTQEAEYQAQNSNSQYENQPQFSETPQQPQLQQQISYVPVEKTQYTPKGEPQSLLDSYVPSVLQYQYYKQQEQQGLNSLVKKSSEKLNQKRYNSPQQIYTIPSDSSELAYPPQLPTTFKSYTSVKSNHK
ncbi:GATA zinc finger domain-containing protein 10-like [Onthophagus taurus]|uniref:GATA zinc finger domain-containing protein 10-like n=1 Tax=Onthophagus taurus TaxID=166361 RepID=UPI0039BDD379